jgi:hypothetical protein
MLSLVSRRSKRVSHAAGELEFRNAVMVCRSSEAIHGSLSMAQRSFIEGNLKDGRSANDVGNGSGKGGGKP